MFTGVLLMFVNGEAVLVTKREIGGEMREMIDGWRDGLVMRRKTEGVTQVEMAGRAGVNPGYISMVEGGHARMTWRLLKVYLEVLGMEIGLREKE